MNKILRRILLFVLVINLLFVVSVLAEDYASDLPLESNLSIMIDARTGHIIHGRGVHQRAYPASMTKVMTALLLVEGGFDLDERIEHSHDAVFSIMPGSSHIAMNPTETLTVLEALYAIMLPSANEVSNAIAEFVAGSMEEFALMMTNRAHELGAINTNFTNAHGLPDPNQFTTPYDMALIMREAVSHDIIRHVINTQRHDIPPTELQPEYRVIYNTNRMIFPTNEHFNPNIVGGKTGWTTASGHTLTSFAIRADMEIITVIMQAEARGVIFSDTNILLDYGFNSFRHTPLLSINSFNESIDLIQRTESDAFVIGQVEVVPESNIMLNLPININLDDITRRVLLPDRVSVPIEAGFNVGRVYFEYNGRVISSTPLLTAHSVDELPLSELVALFEQPAAYDEPAFSHSSSVEAVDSIFGLIINITVYAVLIILFVYILFKFLRFSNNQKIKPRYRGGKLPSFSTNRRRYR